MKLKYAKIIYECRIAAGMTQEQLAEETGLHVNSIRLYETGVVAPRARTFDRVLDACGFELAARKKGASDGDDN